MKVTHLLRHKLKCGYRGQSINAESGTSQNGEKKYYYKCWGRKFNSGCKKAIIRKELLEDIVLENVIGALSNPQTMNKIVSGLMAEQERQARENSILNLLLKEKRQVEISLENLVNAIEQGIISNITNKRLHELERRQEELERQILIERSKQAITIPEKEIREYYQSALKLEPQLLIDLLVKEIVLYNDKIEKTMSRVRYKKTCEDNENREVKQEDIVKGFEYEDGKYVIFEEKDFEKIKTKKDKNITIDQFVDIAEVDPIYFDKPYYIVPTGAEKAYAVLLTAMEQSGKAAIAKTVLGIKETLVMIRAKEGQMLLNTLFFADEVVKNPAKEVTEKGNAAELKMAQTIIESMTGKFEPEQYKDEYREKVQEAIEKKIAGKEIAAPKEMNSGTVSNLMEALTKSLELTKKPKAKTTPVKRTPTKKKKGA